MRLTLDPTVTVGLDLDDLQPLQENCFGFSATVENGTYVYSVPLGECGAEVTVCLVCKKCNVQFILIQWFANSTGQVEVTGTHLPKSSCVEL